MRVDQAWALSRAAIGPPRHHEPFDGDPRFALLTVNFSTTHYLKLLLLTLAEQRDLALVRQIVVADNRSQDGGPAFLRALADRVDRIHVVENTAFLSHGRGMRRAIAHLGRVEREVVPSARANLLLCCDTDVVFLSQHTLSDLAAAVVGHDAALVGELRSLHARPDAHASFLVIRRDVYARRDVRPWVHHGSPAYWMQRSIWRAGLTVVDFPGNRRGHLLHRGRAGVEAAARYLPRHAYAVVDTSGPHFMGVADGAARWDEVEQRYESLTRSEHEAELIEHLARALA